MSSAVRILHKLVAIPSVSSMSNQPLIEAAEKILFAAGWTAQHFPYNDANGLKKINLIARPAHQSAAAPVDLAFVCHTDTVPFTLEAWPAATELTEHDGFLHGCGACDVKGSLAGILAAISQLNGAEIKRPVALVLTADEEIGCIGASKLAAAQAIRARSVLVCEPTSLRPAIAGKDYSLAEVRVTGKEAHSAFPQQGASAIYAAAKMMLAIEAHTPSASAINPLFDPPHTTFNIGVVKGGTAKNVIPGACTFLVEWRSIPNEDPRAAIALLESLAVKTQSESSGCSVHVKALRSDPGFEYSADSPFVQSLSKKLGQQPTGISFGSEATRFAQVADEVVVLGPGNMHTAHSDRECISIAELHTWVDCVHSLLASA
jgi:acetylornithine deacetylase